MQFGQLSGTPTFLRLSCTWMTWWGNICEGGLWCPHVQMFLMFVKVEELFQDRQGFAWLFLIAVRFVTFLKRGKANWQEKQQLENEKKKTTTKQHNSITCSSIVREQECMWFGHNITQKEETNAVSAISCIFTASKRPVSLLYPHQEHRWQLILQI